MSLRNLAFFLLFFSNIGYSIVLLYFGINKSHQLELRVFGFLNLMLIFVSFIMVLLMKSRKIKPAHKLDKYLYSALFSLSMLGFLNALAYSNNFVYVLSDFYKILILPISFFIFSNLIEYNLLNKLVNVLIAALLFDGLFDIAYQIPMYLDGNFDKISDQFWYNKILLILLVTSSYLDGRIRKIPFYFLISIGIIILVLSMYRSAVFLALFGLALLLYKSIKSIKVWELLVFFLFVPLLLINIFKSEGISNYYDKFTDRIELISLSSFDKMESVTLLVKLHEIKSALDKMEEENSISVYLFGTGFGSEYTPNTILRDLSVGYKAFFEVNPNLSTLHQIHVNYFSIFFRYGILGFITVILLYIYIYQLFRRRSKYMFHINSKYKFLYYAVYLYLIITFVAMLFFQQLFWVDINWGFFLAISLIHPQGNMKYIKNNSKLYD